jgi:hypothetical protein
MPRFVNAVFDSLSALCWRVGLIHAPRYAARSGTGGGLRRAAAVGDSAELDEAVDSDELEPWLW